MSQFNKLSIRTIIYKEKENSNTRLARMSHSVIYIESTLNTSGSKSARSPRSQFGRSKSLYQEKKPNSYRSRTLDMCNEKSSSEAWLTTWRLQEEN